MAHIRIAVTGTQGQVAYAMTRLGPNMGADVIAIGRPALDLAELPSILPAIAAARPDVILSAAAYTAVDKAETEPDLAFAANGRGAGAVAQAAFELGVPILHLSTDYVFDGNKVGPYVETDLTMPTSVYGASKLEGEMRVAAANPNHAIFRTAWVYSSHGANFLRTMLRLGETRDEISVVADQFGCPTSAEDIALAMIIAARTLVAEADTKYLGVFHLTGSGVTNWADFAAEIFAAAERHGRTPVKVIPINSDEYPSPVKRPKNSRLLGDKLERVYGVVLPDWRKSTRRVVDTLLGQTLD